MFKSRDILVFVSFISIILSAEPIVFFYTSPVSQRFRIKVLKLNCMKKEKGIQRNPFHSPLNSIITYIIVLFGF